MSMAGELRSALMTFLNDLQRPRTAGGVQTELSKRRRGNK